MQARMNAERTVVTDQMGQPLAELPAGTVLSFGPTVKRNGAEYATVRMRDGRLGFIDGDTKIHVIRKGNLLDKTCAVKATPDLNAPVLYELKKNAEMVLLAGVGEGTDWVYIQDNKGGRGFIDGKTKLKFHGGQVVRAPSGDLIAGGLWCVGGTVVTVATYSAARDGGTYFVAWGAILFGGLQFLRGLYNLIRGGAAVPAVTWEDLPPLQQPAPALELTPVTERVESGMVVDQDGNVLRVVAPPPLVPPPLPQRPE